MFHGEWTKIVRGASAGERKHMRRKTCRKKWDERMQFTLSTNYALRALLYLSKKNRRATSVREISENIQVSQGYLLKVAGKLRQNGILDAAAGPTGGFFLARCAKEITLYDIVYAMEGEVTLCRCREDGSQCRDCEAETCPMYQVLVQAQKTMRKLLSGVSLADIVDRADLSLEIVPDLRVLNMNAFSEKGLDLSESFERLNGVFMHLPAVEREKSYRMGVIAGELARQIIFKTDDEQLRREMIELLDSTMLCGKFADIGLCKAILYAESGDENQGGEGEPYPFHPVWSMDTLRSLGCGEKLRSPQERGMWKTLLRAALYHHENWDGNGYPGKVKGEEIPMIARVMRMANDIVDSLRQGAEAPAIAAMLRDFSGERYDPVLVKTLLRGE